jgi:hypothetical protein
MTFGEPKTSGAGGTLGVAAQAGPAHPLTVGAVGFGPQWEEQPTLRELYDQACASIVRAECEIEELRAEVALAEAERIEMAKMLRSEREMHATCQNERDALAEAVRTSQATIESLRDALCSYKCADKAAADGGWANR